MNKAISIITPSFNQGHFIEETITSVLGQNYPNLEYIIIDGGSTDNTVEIIKKYERHLKYWVSEKDKGQANAINKGLRHCTGEIFNWLNSDDYLEPGALSAISDAFMDDNIQMVAGAVRIIQDEKTIEEVKHKKLSAKGLLYWLPGVSFVQPGVWMRRDLVNMSDGLNENYHYSFDWELYIKYLNQFPEVKYLDKRLIHFRYHNASKTINNQDKFEEERSRIIESFSESKNKKLKSLTNTYLAERKLHARMRNLLASDKSKMGKFINALKEIDPGNLKNFRVIGGALKKIALGNRE